MIEGEKTKADAEMAKSAEPEPGSNSTTKASNKRKNDSSDGDRSLESSG